MKPVSLKEIVLFLNKELRVKGIEDDSRNGLQVRANDKVKKVAFAVDASLETFRKAKELNCDLIVVHHGLLWKDQKFKKETKKRVDYLKKNQLSLYAAHLPLDAHPEYGNNIQLCRLFNIGNLKKFGKYHGFPIGYKGKLNKDLGGFVKEINTKLRTKCFVLAFGPKRIRTIGVVSGGGRAAIEEVIDQKLDCFLVGEMPHSTYHHAQESKTSIIMGGHYATETLGVKAIAGLLKQKFNIETVFIDVPTGM
jgi:dinuclear metal center YbgI/SA1388 family protein